MEDQRKVVAKSDINELAKSRDPKDVVSEICGRLYKIDGNLAEMAGVISFYLIKAPDIFIGHMEEKGVEINYSLAVYMIVERLLGYRGNDEFIITRFPDIVEVINGKMLPREIVSIIIGLTRIPLLLPEEYQLINVIEGHEVDIKDKEGIFEVARRSVRENILVTLIKAVGEFIIYGSYEVYISLRNLYKNKKIIKSNREDPCIRDRIYYS